MSQSDAPRPEDSAPLGDEDTPVEPTDEPAPAATGNRKILFVAAAAVVVLVVAGVVVYLMTGDDSTDTASPDVPTIVDSNSPSSVGPARPPGGATATITAPSSSASSTPAAPAGDAGDAQQVASQAAKAITDSDLGTLGRLSCDPSTVGDDDTFPADAKVEVIGDPQVNGDTATVDVKVTIPNAPPATVPMPLVKQDGRWCIPG